MRYSASDGCDSPVRTRSSSQRSSSASPAAMRATRSSLRGGAPGGGAEGCGTALAAPVRASAGVVDAPSGGGADGTIGAADASRGCTAPGTCVAGTCPRTHMSSSASTCLQGLRRLGHEHADATATWSTTHSYGSPVDPVHRPHSADSEQPVPDHLLGTARGCAAAIADGEGARASTCSTCHTPCGKAPPASMASPYSGGVRRCTADTGPRAIIDRASAPPHPRRCAAHLP